MSRLLSMAVVVPARDEAEVLAECLASVDVARRTLEQSRPGMGVAVLVVLDRCVDRSAAVAARHPGVETLEVSVGCVGAARAAGVAHTLAGTADASRHWLASTDADSVVPPHWLAAQADLADDGHDLVLGTVEPAGVDAHLLRRWTRRHRLRDGHPHVHGANLGIRASRYVEVGGFAAVGLHEDVLLAAAVKATGAPWVATDSIRVQTAGRLEGRVSGGFATYLRELADEPEAVTAAG